MSFTFTGGGGGTFSVSGPPPLFPDISGSSSNWAAGNIDDAATITSVAAVKVKSGGFYDAAIITSELISVGSSTVDADCVVDDFDCTGVSLVINGVNGDEGAFEFLCSLTTGSVVISQVTATRVVGTFSGSGECMDESLNVTAFTVTGGQFNVPLISLQ